MNIEEANPHYAKVIKLAEKIVIDRRQKYSGTFHPFYNFAELAIIRGQDLLDVFLFFIDIKRARLKASRTDFDDESVFDTLVDMGNYAFFAAAAILDGITTADILPDLHNVWDELWPIIGVDLDGVVLENYEWKGIYELPPVADYAFDLLKELSEQATIIVHTARPNDNLPIVQKWLEDHNLMQFIYAVTNMKPPAVLYPDDKAFVFVPGKTTANDILSTAFGDNYGNHKTDV
jgi:hypothetical protein